LTDGNAVSAGRVVQLFYSPTGLLFITNLSNFLTVDTLAFALNTDSEVGRFLQAMFKNPLPSTGDFMSERKRLIAVVLVFICVATVGTAAALFGSTAPPGLTWSAPSVAPTVIAGSAATATTVSLTATGKLPDAVVQLSPAFAGLVTVSPSDLGTVRQGQTVTLTLTARAPASSTPATVQGSIQIQKKTAPTENYGSPLAVSIHVTWPVLSNQGVTVVYPPLWTVDQGSLSLGGPISLRNFPQYSYGGIRPRGGADINIARAPFTQASLNETIATDLTGANIDSTSNEQVAGISATRVRYHADYTPITQERGVVVYVPFGAFLYKFYLSYDLGDPNEPTFLETFDDLVASTSLTAN
jgi:hypothetical protein